MQATWHARVCIQICIHPSVRAAMVNLSLYWVQRAEKQAPHTWYLSSHLVLSYHVLYVCTCIQLCSLENIMIACTVLHTQCYWAGWGHICDTHTIASCRRARAGGGMCVCQLSYPVHIHYACVHVCTAHTHACTMQRTKEQQQQHLPFLTRTHIPAIATVFDCILSILLVSIVRPPIVWNVYRLLA